MKKPLVSSPNCHESMSFEAAQEPRASLTPLSGQRAATSVSFLLSALIGGALSVAIYGTLHTQFRGSYVWSLLTTHGWVPPVIVIAGAWAAGIVFLKVVALSRQKKWLRRDPLPASLGPTIEQRNTDVFRDHVLKLSAKPRESFLLHRILRALAHFKLRGNVQETRSLLDAQAAMDADAVDSSYSLLRVFIWAIPILGFIGTVVGIGHAVAGFSGSIQNVEDMALIKDSLTGVTAGLSTAFETTLLALVVSIVIVFPARALQKSEEDLLGTVSEYCNDQLILRLESPQESVPESPIGIRSDLRDLMGQQGAEFNRWSKQLESIGESIGRRVASAWDGIQSRLDEGIMKHVAKVQGVLDAAAAHQKEFTQTVHGFHEAQMKKLSEATTAVVRSARDVQKEIAESQQAQERAAEKIVSSLGENLRKLGEQAIEGQLAGVHTVRKLAVAVKAAVQGQLHVSQEIGEELKKGAHENVMGLREETRVADKRMRQFLAALQVISRNIDEKLGKKIEQRAARLEQSTKDSEKLVKLQYVLANNLKVLAAAKPFYGTLSKLTGTLQRLEVAIQDLDGREEMISSRLDATRPHMNGISRWFGGRRVAPGNHT